MNRPYPVFDSAGCNIQLKAELILLDDMVSNSLSRLWSRGRVLPIIYRKDLTTMFRDEAYE